MKLLANRNSVTSVPLLPLLLWHNAGFSSLRKRRELDFIEARYDPTVIPISKPDDEEITSYTDVNIVDLRVPPKDAKGRLYTTVDFHEAYKSGRLTPTEVVEGLLPIIRRGVPDQSPHAIAFIDTKVDLVMQAAEASTQRWQEGKPLGILDGVPFAVKDEMDFKDYKRYNGTRNDFTKDYDVESSWCAKMIEQEGAIMMGKLNMHEIGLDTSTNNPIWGTPRNPYNQEYYCGGSSGGPGYVVASGIVPFALGSDGGGSIRIPSNYCGIYGLKPSQGRVSIAPLPAFVNSCVVQGPLAATMADLQISYRVLAQPDPTHPVSQQFAPPSKALLSKPRNKILGVCKTWFDRADPLVQEACYSALRYFTTELGYETVDITIPMLHEGQMAHAMVILAEVASIQKDLSYLTGPNKVLLKVGQQTPASDFVTAQRLRNLLMQHLAYLFQKHPGLIIVTPTTPNAGWPIGAGELSHGVSDGNMQVRNMEYVWLANFTGMPCIQFPVGYVDPKQGNGKVPVGLSGQGEWGSEESLIEFGFDGEKWLNEEYEEGRRRPEGWVDVLGKSR